MDRDTVQLETAVSTISQEYLLEFTSEYSISKALHPELPGPKDRIVDFPEGKVGVYTKFFEFANFRLPLSQFLFDILGYYQIHLSQLFVICATKVSHFEINCRVLNIVPTLRLFRVFYTPSFNSGWMSFSKRPEKNTPQCYTKPLDFLKNWNNRFFWVDERVFSTIVDWRTSAPKDDMPAENTYSLEAVRVLDTHRTPIQKQPEALLCLVGLSRRYYLGDEVFEKEANLLKKSVAQVAHRDKRIQARENEIKNLETLLEAEADMKKAAEDKSTELSQELENMWALFSDLQAAFEEFKQYKDNRVEQRCAEMDARLDTLSIDFDEELYPHMLTAIAGRRWMIGRGLRLAVMKCGESIKLRQAFVDVVSAGIAKGMSEGLKHGVEHGQAQLDLEAIKAYDPEAEAKYIAALQALKNLKYSLVDQLEGLKDAPMDVIMASLHLESDTRDDAPQWVRELRPSSSQLTIPVYPEVHDPMDHWACKEEILLADAIAANVSRAEKKKKCRVVCRTHGVGSTHHARSDGVPVSVPTVVPQGLAILLADAAIQTETSDEAS
nr:transposase (putative), gypsy type [Tanacetum cinerariifolium]